MSKEHYYLFHNDARYELIPNQPYVFGRVRGDLSFAEDELISRRHAIIEWQGERLLLKDLGSTNGTKLNGGSCKEGFLSSGDEIEIGSQKVTFVLEKEGDGAPSITDTRASRSSKQPGTDTLFIERKVRSLLDELKDPTLKEQVEDIKSLYDKKKNRDQPQPVASSSQIDVLHDELTGVSNRRFFDLTIKNEIERAKRYEGDLALLLVEVDHFNDFGGSYDASTVDSILLLIALILEHNCRESDSVCRFDEGQFALILPETDSKNAFIVAEKLRAKVEELSTSRIQVLVTVSVGIAEFDCIATATAEDLIFKASQLIGKAKDAGCNQVSIDL